jgi:hypothetical protein
MERGSSAISAVKRRRSFDDIYTPDMSDQALLAYVQNMDWDDLMELRGEFEWTETGWNIAFSVRGVAFSDLYISDISLFRNATIVKMLKSSVVRGFENLGNVTVLVIDRTKITSAEPFVNVPRLKIRGAPDLTFDMLGRQSSLYLQDCNIRDARPFAGVDKLSLSMNKNLRSTAGLGSQTYLDVSYTAITDVDELANVTCLVADGLTLQQPKRVFSCKMVAMAECNLRDFSFLREVPAVDVSRARNGLLLDTLGSQQSLAASSCGIRDATPLARVSELYLDDNFITNVDALGSQTTLDLSGCPMMNVDSLANVRNLSISNTGVIGGRALGNHYFLDISNTDTASRTRSFSTMCAKACC